MFDTVLGLPVHPLVVHAVVVLLPLMAVLTVVAALRPALPRRLLWWVVGGNAVVFGVTLVARESGLWLRSALGGQVAAQHAALGNVLPWFSLLLVVASAGLALSPRYGPLRTLAVTVSILAAVAAVAWTVRTGDSGARAVWGGRF